MSKYQLTMSTNYVANWGLVEAVREIFQNAIDQAHNSADNQMSWVYLGQQDLLRISNKSSVLDKRSLLLGESTKSDNDKMIGQFGEGYKLALLVLTRMGKKVTIYNYGAREVWTARLVNSRKFGATILEVDVDTKFIWSSVPDNDLTWEIRGVTVPEFDEELLPSNLILRADMEDIDYLYKSEEGSVLADELQVGRVYVNGLFVSKVEGLKYGYSLPPNKLKLDRDRGLVDNFDLCWELSKLWSSVLRETPEKAELILNLLITDAPEVRYLTSQYYGKELIAIAERYVDNQVDWQGENIVFISSGQTVAPEQIAGRSVISVPSQLRDIINQSERARYTKLREGRSMVEILRDMRDFYRSTKNILPKERHQELAKLVLEQAAALGMKDYELEESAF